MSKHRLFTPDEESLDLNSSNHEANTEPPSPRRKGKENTNKSPHEVQRSEQISKPSVQSHSIPKPGAEVGNEKTQNGESNKNVNQFHPSVRPVCVSDSDSMDEEDFFSKGNSGAKLPYTLKEDEFIIKYVLKGRNIFRASSISLWKILESKKENPKRTYQSLKNRFLKSIRPRLFTTYSYMIKNKEVENIILEKYPDLKKKRLRKDIFSTLNFPKRPYVLDLGDETNPSGPVVLSAARESSSQNQNSNVANHVNERNSEQRNTTVCDTQNMNRVYDCEITHLREVTLRKDATIVTVKFRKSLTKKSSTSPPPVGIYSKFLTLKNQNKLVPCPTCSKLGFKINEARRNSVVSDSDSDNDDFIPNSVETPLESNSKTPPGSNRVRTSLPPKEVRQKSLPPKEVREKSLPPKEVREKSLLPKEVREKSLPLKEVREKSLPPREGKKSVNTSNSEKSKNNSKEVKNTPKNSNPRNTRNTPVPKGGKTIPANSKSSNSENNITSKELKQLLEDSYSRNIVKRILPKDFSANKKRKTNPTSQSSNKSPEKTPNSSQRRQVTSGLLTPPSRNLRKSVRKRVVKKVSNDIKVNKIATRKQPARNLDIAKPTTSTTTVTAEDSGKKLSGRPCVDRQAKKSKSHSRQLKNKKKRMNAYNVPLRISTLTHRDRFILRKLLRRTHRIYRRNLLESKEKESKPVKKQLKKKQMNREEKKTNLQTQSESDSLNDNYLRSLYKETVSECRRLVNSDEEERRPDQNDVRDNSMRQNTVDNHDELLKSFFMESESETDFTNSFTQNTKSSFDDTASSSLADNMMKMLSRF